VFRIVISDINEELFYPDIGYNIVVFSLHLCKWRVFCAEKFLRLSLKMAV